MKKILLIILALTGLSANAQFFHHNYGTSANDYANVGINIRGIGGAPLGHFVTGVTFDCLPVNAIPSAYTDVNGNIPTGTSHFKKSFLLVDPSTKALLNPGGGIPMEFSATCGNPSSYLGMVGLYTDPAASSINNSRIYFMHVLPGGIPSVVYTYEPPAGYNVVATGDVTRSNNYPGDWFLTGSVQNTSNNIRYPFVLRINECSGNVVWGKVYEFTGANIDRVQSWGVAENLGTPFSVNSIAIVGELREFVSGGTNTDGFLLHIDATNGSVPAGSSLIRYGTPTSFEVLRSIEPAVACPQTSVGDGFVLAGFSNANNSINTSQDYYVARVDVDGITATFTNTYDYGIGGTGQNQDNRSYQAQQRINSTCKCEYYVSGNTFGGFFGNSDIMVLKLDAAGSTGANNQYLYGGTENEFAGTDISVRNCSEQPTNADGISIYASWASPTTIGGVDMRIIRTYFNGRSTDESSTDCPENFDQTKNVTAFSGTVISGQSIVLSDITKSTDINAVAFEISDQQKCYTSSIREGSNARVAPSSGKNNEALLILPNPATKAEKEVQLEFESEVEGEALVEIYDLLGKKYYSHKHILKKGSNRVPVEISVMNMATGMYSVKLSNSNNSETVLLMVK